jgi:O-antigen/teichoic acid export membrane protein
MKTIRRQSIISSALVYAGFALGLLNTYLFTREGSGFSKSDYGLINVFIALGSLMFSFASLGMPAYIGKFFPYYKDHLQRKNNDMAVIALGSGTVGFILVMLAGWLFKDLVIQKYGTNAPDLITYYKWIFPFGMGYTFYCLLEAYAWQLQKTILTNFLREVQFRALTTLLIIVYAAGLIHDFGLFIKCYALTYLVLALSLAFLLYSDHELQLTFQLSKVTRRFRKKIFALVSFIWSGSLLFMISSVFDTLVISAVLPNGLAFAGIYTLAQNMGSLIQAPQRGIASASIAVLSRSWKDKNLQKINQVYHSSSINQVLFACGMFLLIWMNFNAGVSFFHLQTDYLQAKEIFFYIGLMRIIDMGTGVNAQIIGTSTKWRFDFITGIILIVITLPLNYWMTKHMGAVGPAIANLFSISIYNAVRFYFLWKNFKLQPFDQRTLYALLLAAGAYGLTEWLCHTIEGLPGILVRSALFLMLYIAGAIKLQLSSDIIPVWHTILKRTGIKK